MTDKTALFGKAPLGFCCVLAGTILLVFGISSALAVPPPNTPPAAKAQTVKGSANLHIRITLTGSDYDGDTLTYEIVQPPARGTLTGTPPNVTYIPGSVITNDYFTFRVSDGTYFSAPATVRVNPYNLPDNSNVSPAGHNQVLRTSSGSVAITLTGSDADGDSITFTTVGSNDNEINGPNCGTLSGAPPNLTYTFDSGMHPTCSYAQTDGFSFQVVDSKNNYSVDLARIDIYLTSDPPGPVANAGSNIGPKRYEPVTLNGAFHHPGEEGIAYQNWTCTDPSSQNCCEDGDPNSYCSDDCTLDNPGQADPTFEASSSGNFTCDYYVEDSAGAYSFDRINVDVNSEIWPESSYYVAPSADAWHIVLLVGFCALIGIRYVRKNVRNL